MVCAALDAFAGSNRAPGFLVRGYISGVVEHSGVKIRRRAACGMLKIRALDVPKHVLRQLGRQHGALIFQRNTSKSSLYAGCCPVW